MASPVVANRWPIASEEYAHPQGSVYLEVTDADGDLVAGSVILKINGVVAWSSDAQQNNFSVTKTAITNGFSYEVQPHQAFMRGTAVFVDVYADDGVNTVSDKYTFTIGSTKYLVFQDLFNDGVQNPKLTYDPNNGVITETGGELKLDGPDSQNCDWWASVANAPKVYAAIPSLVRDFPVGVLMVESRLSNYAESAANVSFGGGPILYNDDQNVYYSGFYDNVNDIRFERGIANSFSSRYNSGDGQVHPSTTAHRYRILWNNTDQDVYVGGRLFLKGVIHFRYSVDDGATWVEAFNEAMALSQPQNFGVFLKKYNAGAFNAQAYIDYLELWELVPDNEVEEKSSPPKTLFEDRVAFPTQSDDARHQYPAQGEGVVVADNRQGKNPQPKVLFNDRVEFPAQSGDEERHQYPNQPSGAQFIDKEHVAEPQPYTQFEDRVQYYRSIDTTYTKTTLDGEGHNHFIGERVVKAFLYEPLEESALWTNPTDPNFTGYGKNGYEYINGVVQPAGPHAPWALESSGTDRSSRADFPDHVLIVYTADGQGLTPAEVVIFDLDNYPTNIDVWMRFRFGPSGGNYTMMGRINQKPTMVRMVNGVLVVSTQEGDYRGAVHIIDFKAVGKDCGHYIRSDNHLKWQPANGIADRNLTGTSQWSTTGVSPSLRISPEDVWSIALVIDDEVDNRWWLAVGGEDKPVQVIRIDSSVPQEVYQGSGEQGDGNIGNKRQVFFDSDGWLWFSIDNWLYRTLKDYKEGLLHAPSDDLYGRGISNRVQLPYTITGLAVARNYIFASTDYGIYVVHRGTLQAHLAYTGPDDGGGGMDDNPPDGEKMLANSEVIQMEAFSLDLASYLTVATRLSGGGALIRTLDDALIEARVFPQLHLPGAWFHLALRG